MKKASKLMYLLNIALGLLLSFVYLFMINYSLINIFIFIIINILYILLIYKFYRKNKEVDRVDFMVMNIYILSVIFIFIYNIIMQMNVSSLSFIYNNFYLYIIHLIYILYNCFR
jgi:hypothetical protein